MIVASARILGVTGAPCTGKTTLVEWLARKLGESGCDCEQLPEPARILAAHGVLLDTAQREEDYDAFLTAYNKRDAGAIAPLAIADRTPVCHMGYITTNANASRDFVARHRDAAIGALAQYRLLLYLPVQFPMVDDGFRETSLSYQRSLDGAISAMLAEVEVPIVELRGDKRQRRQSALAAIREYWPELHISGSMAASGAGS
jgi:nicotinamide riboside kinase